MCNTKDIALNKSDIDNRLQCIANLLLLNASFVDNLGILNGKMGIAIFFYHYYRLSGNKIYEEYAGELIDEIYEDISPGTLVSFEDGLTGIGWGIEYLVRNGFVQADTDEALSEIDNAIYRARINSPILINNGKELFGYGHYYIKRLTGKEINDDDLNTLIKKYHLIFLTDECERILLQDYYKGFNIESLSTDTINSFIWFLLEMNHLEIFPSKTKKVLQKIPFIVESSFQNSPDTSGLNQMKALLTNILPHILEPVSKDSPEDNPEIDMLEKYNIKSSDVKIEDFIKNTWQQIVFEPYVARENEAADYFNKVFSAIDNEKKWNIILENLDKSRFGLTGLAGLGLGLVFEGLKNESRTTCQKSEQTTIK